MYINIEGIEKIEDKTIRQQRKKLFSRRVVSEYNVTIDGTQSYTYMIKKYDFIYTITITLFSLYINFFYVHIKSSSQLPRYSRQNIFCPIVSSSFYKTLLVHITTKRYHLSVIALLYNQLDLLYIHCYKNTRQSQKQKKGKSNYPKRNHNTKKFKTYSIVLTAVL